MRSLMLRFTVLALLVPAAAFSPLADPASAVTADVMSMEWQTQQSSGSQLTQTAGFTAYGSTSATMARGARFSIPNTLRNVTVAPPTGTSFVPGQTYGAAPTATATTAKLAFGSGVFSTALCPTSTVATFAGSVTVHAAQYDDAGALTELAADYRGTCSLSSGAEETVAGSVRHNTTTPWLTLRPVYPSDTVAMGRERVSAVTLSATGSGKSVQLGQATISGVRAADYRVSDNGCAGTTLGDGGSCQLDVSFEPLPLTGGGSNRRVAVLSVATVGHVVDPVRVRLDSMTTEVPAAPQTVTTYPTANGVGVSWAAGWPSAQQYRLERRLSGDTAWTTVATIAAGGPYNHVDHDTEPGQEVEYRVTGVNAGWDGESATTSTTRPMSVPSPGPDTLLAYGSNDAAGPSATIRGGVDGGTVTTWGSDLPTIQATAGPTGTAMAPARVTYRVPVVPGPGEYRSGDRMSGWPSFGAPSLNCTYTDSVLEVRSVAYDETRKPLVFDGSWAGRCGDGTVVRLELRLGVDTDHALLTTDPAVVGRLTTYGGRSETRTVTVSNAGPGDVILGGTTLTGSAAGDWLVTDNACDTAVLHPAETCAVTVRFSNLADNARPAVLEVAGSDPTGPLAPVTVPLDGFGATVPAAPYGSARGTVGAVLVWWRARDDGGRPILSYDLQRRLSGASEWTQLATVPAGPHLSFADQAVGTDGYDYRLRASNEVGPGPWARIGSPGTTAGRRAVVVSGSTSDTGPLGLYQVSSEQDDAPVIALTHDPQHDFRDPAVSPAGSRLAVSVSNGDGSDGEYDLWSGTLGDPTIRRLTSMPGAEREPSYSPDARTIAFTRAAPDGSRSVWVVSALGGNPREVRAQAADPAWMPDGRSLLVEDHSTPDAPLLVVDLATGSAVPLAGTEAGTQPSVSRAGDVAYVDAAGRILVMESGTTQPSLHKGPGYLRVLGSPAYDDLGHLYYDITATDTGKTSGSLTGSLARAGEPAPVLADLSAPWVTPQGLADFVHGRADVDVVYGDHDETPAVALRPQCRLDGAAWQGCAGPTSFVNLSEGQHFLAVRVSDEAGHTTTASYGFVSDTTAPRLTMTTPRLSSILDGAVTFGWNGSDVASGLSFYDVAVRTATPTTGFTPYRPPTGWTGTGNRLRVHIPLGQELCVRVRVRDGSGLWGRYVTRCVARPVDDTALNASAGWRRARTSGLFRRTETTTTREGARLSTSSAVTTRRIAVLATTCRTCGAVKIYVGSRYVGTVSLRTSRTRARQLLALPVIRQPVTGKVVLKTTSSRLVRADGLMLARN